METKPKFIMPPQECNETLLLVFKIFDWKIWSNFVSCTAAYLQLKSPTIYERNVFESFSEYKWSHGRHAIAFNEFTYLAHISRNTEITLFVHLCCKLTHVLWWCSLILHRLQHEQNCVSRWGKRTIILRGEFLCYVLAPLH